MRRWILLCLSASVSVACPLACSNAAATKGAIDAAGNASDGGGFDGESAGCADSCSGACSEGRCLVVLAQSSSPVDIVVDGTSVYFTSCNGGRGAVIRVPANGGPPATLAVGTGCPISLALSETEVYVAGLDGNDIAGIPIVGGAPTTLVPSRTDTPIGIAVDGTDVYWTTQGGAVMRAPIDGGVPVVLASAQNAPTRPVVGGTDVYWGTGSDVQKVSRYGGSVMSVASAAGVTTLAISGAYVYFADGYLVKRVPLDGGGAAIVGTPTGAPVEAMTVDESNVYFVSWGTIWETALASGNRFPIATSQRALGAIAVDDTSVYWPNAIDSTASPDNGDSQIMKLTPK